MRIRDAIILSVFTGTVGAALGSITTAAIDEGAAQHDPALMLRLRTDCLNADAGRSAFLSWCNDYAERYSRIARKP